jgi:hypothetical protein
VTKLVTKKGQRDPHGSAPSYELGAAVGCPWSPSSAVACAGAVVEGSAGSLKGMHAISFARNGRSLAL